MLRESHLENFESLVQAYAAISAYASKSQEIEDQIERAFVEAAKAKPTMSDVCGIIGRQIRPWELTRHRAAWIAQHVFDARAYSVGNLIVSTRRTAAGTKHFSPLVEQVCRRNGLPAEIDLVAVEHQLSESRYVRAVDAVLLDGPAKQITVLGALSLSKSKKPTQEPRSIAMTGPLFGDKSREVVGLRAPAKTVGALWVAAEMLAAAFPYMSCRIAFAVIDDTPFSHGFVLHDLTGAGRPEGDARHVLLDAYPLLDSSLEWKRRGGDLDDLDQVPGWVAEDRLSNLPVDRPTRAHMVLSVMWRKQLKAPGRLVWMSKSEIARSVVDQYNLEYTQDLRRHDIEDCLERSGYIDRAWSTKAEFSLTPSGVARIVLFRRLMSTVTDTDVDNGLAMDLLAHIQRQAILWKQHRDGVAAA